YLIRLMKLLKLISMVCLTVLIKLDSYSQNVTITPGGITPALSAVYPRLTYAQIIALPNPQQGDLVFDLTNHAFRVFNSRRWVFLSQDPGDITPLYDRAFTTNEQGYYINYQINDMVIDATENIFVTGSYKRIDGSIFLRKYNKFGLLIFEKTG